MSAPLAATLPSKPLEVEHAAAALKGQGSYNSLRQALKAARYRIEPPASASASPYQAWNPAQRIQAEFAAEETRLRHWGYSLALRLTGYGYGERLRKPQAARVMAEGNRVEYRRGALVEWYVNQTQGLEQGFTLSRLPDLMECGGLPPLSSGRSLLRPGARASSRATKREQAPALQRAAPNQKLVLAMSFAGSLRPVVEADGQAVQLQAQGRTVLRYEGLKVWDATGHVLPSRLEVQRREVRIVVDDGGAVYPLTLDPAFVQDAKLTASDAAAGDRFGFPVAASGDTAVIGANSADTAAGVDAGSAYVFVRSSAGLWTQQQKLTASDAAAGDGFGISVALSGDTAVVGASLADTAAGADAGSAYVFVRSGGVWTQQQKLTASDAAASDKFGSSVAVSGDTAVVTAPLDDTTAGADAGSAYVFVRSGDVWTQQQKLTAADGAAGDGFGGNSVALSGDTAIVGAPSADTPAGTDAGAAYVFVRSSGVWSEQQKLTASDGGGFHFFGDSVTMDGNTAVVGARAGVGGVGSAYVFVRSANVWVQQQKLTAPSDLPGGHNFGQSVALSGDTAIVGTTGGASSAYVFARSGSAWSQNQKLTATDGAAGDGFGSSRCVAISGTTVVVGAPGDDTAAGTDAGSAYVFTRRSKPQTIIVQQRRTGGGFPPRSPRG